MQNNRDIMKILSVFLLASLGLVSGCASWSTQRPHFLRNHFPYFGSTAHSDESHRRTTTLPSIDLSKPPTKRDQYFIGKFARGALLKSDQGELFSKRPQHPDTAMVYFYRLQSHWNQQEVIAPSFFLNGKRIPSLTNNRYYWIELPAGQYRLTLSRPLAVLHFQKPKVADFKVEAGQDYFLKYEEQKFRGKPDDSLGLLKVGPFIQMPTSQGLKEIKTTLLLRDGIRFVHPPQAHK